MILANALKQRSGIGLDTGHGATRAAQLVCRGKTFTITAWGCQARHSPCDGLEAKDRRKDDPPPPPTSAVPAEDEVRDCLRQGRFRRTDVILGLDPPHAEFIALEVPEAVLQPGNADVNQVVHFEIQRLSALAAKAPIQSDYWRLPRASTAAPNVLGVAAAAEHVASLLKFSEQAGLQGCRVEAGALALSRFGALLNDWPEGQVWGVLDLGRAQSRLVLVVQEVPVLIRLVGGGGKAWTDRIASSLRVSRKSAETLKQEHGVDSSQGGTILTGLLRNDLHEVASEIKRSYEYVLSCYPAKKAGGLVLAGGGAAMPKLDELLGGLLGIPVTRAGSFLGTPGCRLRFDDCLQGPREIIETGAVAIGLAVEE